MLCFRKILVAKKYMDKREGQVSRFPPKTFCLTMLNNFVGEPFRVSLIWGIEKFYASEGYVTIFDFLSNFFCLKVPKNFVGDSFSVSLTSGIEKFYASEVMLRFSVENFLSHSTEKFRRGTLQCCVSEIFW